MSETSLKPVIDKLENLFSKFNEKFYNGELQTPDYYGKPRHNKGCLRKGGESVWRLFMRHLSRRG